MLIQQAWNSCPLTVVQTGGCLSTVDWRTVDPFHTKMTISERRASAVFNRFNFTITDVINLSDPVPTNYTGDDFFVFYEIIFAVDESNTDSFKSTQYLFLTSVASYLRDEVDTQLETGTDDRLSRLQEFLAVHGQRRGRLAPAVHHGRDLALDAQGAQGALRRQIAFLSAQLNGLHGAPLFRSS